MKEINTKLSESQIREKFYSDTDESAKAEFINGEVIIHLPSTKKQNQITGLLLKLLNIYCYKHNLGFVGFEKIMTVFSRNDYEPDIVFFGNEKAKNFTQEQTLFPTPDFVVEILSKSTAKNDRGVKFDDYETHQVQEYWIIDPSNEVVEQYILQEKRYELALKSDNGTIKSRVIEGFEIPIRAIFDIKVNFETLQKLLN